MSPRDARGLPFGGSSFDASALGFAALFGGVFSFDVAPVDEPMPFMLLFCVLDFAVEFLLAVQALCSAFVIVGFDTFGFEGLFTLVVLTSYELVPFAPPFS